MHDSSNAIVKDILEDATESTKEEIEALISGEAVEKEIVPELTCTDLDSEDISQRSREDTQNEHEKSLLS